MMQEKESHDKVYCAKLLQVMLCMLLNFLKVRAIKFYHKFIYSGGQEEWKKRNSLGVEVCS